MKNVTTLSDSELLSETHAQMRRSADVDAELLVLLAEVEERNLFLELGYSKMHYFCTDALGMSEDVAYNRVEVASVARRFPLILDYVRDGRLHLTGARLLRKHLTPDNIERVLAAAANKTRKEIEYLVATLAPQPDVPARVTKVPTPAAPATPSRVEQPTSEPAAILTPPPPPPPRRDEVTPLSAATYKVVFTVDAETKAKLDQAAELLGHQVKKGDLAAIVGRALDVLIAKVKKEKYGIVEKPRSTVEQAQAREKHTRHVPAAMRRHIHERDGGQCTWVGPDGHRCEEKHRLELDHLDGWAHVHRHDVDRIVLRCRAHNQHAADKLYGRDFMEAKRHPEFRPGTNLGLML